MGNTQPLISNSCEGGYHPALNGFKKVDMPAELYFLLERILDPMIINDKNGYDLALEGGYGCRDHLKKINVESHATCTGLLKLRGTLGSENLKWDASKVGDGYIIKGTLGENKVDIKVEKDEKKFYTFKGKIGDMEFERNVKKVPNKEFPEFFPKSGDLLTTIDILSTPQKDDIVEQYIYPGASNGGIITGKAGEFEIHNRLIGPTDEVVIYPGKYKRGIEH